MVWLLLGKPYPESDDTPDPDASGDTKGLDEDDEKLWVERVGDEDDMKQHVVVCKCTILSFHYMHL